MGIGNYAQHAKVWDWGGNDRSSEHEYWYQYAREYGNSVLIPMCAWGETGAYMAERGMVVTAFDFTQEMIDEGKKRFGDVAGLTLLQGDIRTFDFDMPPADFAYVGGYGDLGHVHTIEDTQAAFLRIASHLRKGGVFVLEEFLPPTKTECYPRKTFEPVEQVYPDRKVWKTGETRLDMENARTYYNQTIYIENADGTTETFDHAFYLQWFARDVLIDALNAAGFQIQGEYSDHDKTPWHEGDNMWIVEAVKR